MSEVSIRGPERSAGRRFLIGEARRRPIGLLLFLLGSVVAGALEAVGVGLVFPLLYLMIAPQAIDRFGRVAELMRSLGIETRQGMNVFLIACIAVVTIAKNGYMAGFYRLQMRTVARWKTDLSRRLMRMYLFSDFDVHMRKNSSEIIRNLSLVGLVYDQCVMSGIHIVTNSIVAAGLVCVLVATLPVQAVVGVSVLVATVAGLYLASRRIVVDLGTEANVVFERRQRVLQMSIGAIRETKILGKEGYFVDRFARVERESFENQRNYNFMAILPVLVMETVLILSILGFVTHILFVAEGATHALATVGLMGAAMFRLLPQANRIMSALHMINLGKHSIETVATEIDRLEPRVHVPAVDLGRLPFEDRIVLEGVSFVYPGATEPALQDVSLEIRRNEFVGITGPSGSGKSTLLGILMGLLVPNEGRVLVDGQELADPTMMRRWQNSIGWVPQAIFVIEDSFLGNIAFGEDEGQVDRERLERAVRLARLDEVVASRPLGIDESVGEYGANLSGGERQRLGIARALYREPEFIAFDEATAALDVETEQAVSRNVRDVRGRVTIVAIAHRLTTLQDCDRLIVMEKGRVAGSGTLESLCDSNPTFRRMVELSRVREKAPAATGAGP